MLHEPATPTVADHAANYKMRLGILMFILYLLFYAGFVAINLMFPLLMEATVLGLNLATVYGFGLIVVALIEALIYNWLCRRKEQALDAGQTQQGQDR